MKNKWIAILLVLGFIFSMTGTALAQSDYSFQLTNEIVNVYLNKDGSMSLDYQLTFLNDPGAHPIDFVDLGLPNSDFERSSITADVAGSNISVTSDYQGNGSGVALDLGSNAITKSGTVHAYVGKITNMFHPDTSDSTYASSEFSPTYFGSQYVHGNTDLTVVFHLPPEVLSTEPRYHNTSGSWPGSKDPTGGYDSEGRITYTWNSPDANGSTQYTFGASFPKKYIPDSAIVTEVSGSGFFDFLTCLPVLGFFCFFGFFIIGLPAIGIYSDRKRKLQYIKPVISIEGHGIKRGLTAVEAAILLGQPLDKVMTMILFSTIKKNALQVISKDPLKVQVMDPPPADLRDYEKDFAAAMQKDDPERKGELRAMTVSLVNSVTEKMKGFSRKETLDYYKAINEKAWQEINQAGTPEVKSQLYEDNLDWTMLDNDFDGRTRRTFSSPIFVPTWWGRYDPTFGPSSPSSTSVPGMSAAPSGRVSLPGADLASSMVGGIQNFSNNVLGDVNTFTRGVTNVTNPVPVPTRSSSGGGSHSGGCACACACAGCACACAGGGR